MKIRNHHFVAKLSSWVQKKYDEECGGEERRQLEGMELVAFAIVLLGQKLGQDLDQAMAWGDKGMSVIPKIASILAVSMGVLFVLAQVAQRLIPGFHIP